MKQITDNVYVEDRFGSAAGVIGYRGCNYGFVTTSEGIVMIDTPMMPTDAIKLLFEIAKKGEIRYIINTGNEHDHNTGNSFFPGIIVAHETARDVPREVSRIVINQIKRVGSGAPVLLEYPEESAANLEIFKNYFNRPPTITFSENLNLYLGEQTIELIHTPGHHFRLSEREKLTGDNIGVLVPKERVFFTGCLFLHGSQPVFGGSLPLKLVESLKKIEAIAMADKIDYLVPGHGAVVSHGEILPAVKKFRLFAQSMIDMVKDAIDKGMSKEEAINKLKWDFETIPDAHADAKFRKAGGFEERAGRSNISHLYDMLSRSEEEKREYIKERIEKRKKI